MRFSLNTIFIFGVMLHAPAFGADKMICAFKGVGSKEFVRTSDGTAFIGDDDKILTVLETERFCNCALPKLTLIMSQTPLPSI